MRESLRLVVTRKQPRRPMSAGVVSRERRNIDIDNGLGIGGDRITQGFVVMTGNADGVLFCSARVQWRLQRLRLSQCGVETSRNVGARSEGDSTCTFGKESSQERARRREEEQEEQ